MTVKNPQRTKKFRALLAVLGSEEAAVTAWNEANPENPVTTEHNPAVEVSVEVQTLVDAGFSLDEATKYAAQAAEPAATFTSKEEADVAIAKRGFVPVRGRVYGDGSLIEAQVRVLKTGKPEIVELAGEHRVKAVAIWRTDDEKTFAAQNLGTPSA